MTDPARLLTTARTSLERELLCCTQTDVAPDAVRARVLQAVTEAFATPAMRTAAGGDAAGSNCVAATATAGMGARLAGALLRLNSLSLHSLSLRSLSLRSLTLVGLLVVGVGVVFALRQPTEQRSERQVTGQWAAEPIGLPAARADRSAAPALANTRSSADGTEYLSEQRRATGESLAEVEASSRMDTGERELPPDWLGAQLQLLRAVRGYLASGNLEQAAELLDGYEQQFPGGVVGPQIRGLRAQLRQQRSSGSSVP